MCITDRAQTAATSLEERPLIMLYVQRRTEAGACSGKGRRGLGGSWGGTRKASARAGSGVPSMPCGSKMMGDPPCCTGDVGDDEVDAGAGVVGEKVGEMVVESEREVDSGCWIGEDVQHGDNEDDGDEWVEDGDGRDVRGVKNDGDDNEGEVDDDKERWDGDVGDGVLLVGIRTGSGSGEVGGVSSCIEMTSWTEGTGESLGTSSINRTRRRQSAR
jgi:hypothetical protein